MRNKMSIWNFIWHAPLARAVNNSKFMWNDSLMNSVTFILEDENYEYVERIYYDQTVDSQITS